MRDADERTGREAGEETEEWSVSGNPAMRAVLDHIAEELAVEFVRLMKAAVTVDSEAKPEEEKR